MKKKANVSFLLMLVLILSMVMGCGNKNVTVDETATEDSVSSVETKQGTDAENGADAEATPSTGKAACDVTIVYTNDVHSYIDNVVKDENGEVIGDGLRFSKIAAMVQDMRDAGDKVFLVDAGDEIQGSVYGAMDEGATIIEIMNATGYQLATPGNHEFDFGVLNFLKHAENANFPYITCNFHSTDGSEIIFTDSYIADFGGTKVAFVGVTTPSTMTSSTPTYFQNEKGEFIYVIDGASDPKDMYRKVQSAIDYVKDKADYVIGLGHLGVGLDDKIAGIASENLIANVSGFDAFIDGHSHDVMEGNIIKDKDGNDVILTQTGNYLSNVGVMTIKKDGTISTKLVSDYDREDEKVAALEDAWIQSINEQMGEKIGALDTPLYINNPNNSDERWVRAREMNSGDFVADSIYWYFNEKLDIACDAVIQNGGGVRAELSQGDLSYFSAKQVLPYGNMICLIEATGQQIIDALEMGTNLVGEWDTDRNSPAENGGFLHVSGITYDIDTTVESSVETDENGLFVGGKG